MSPGLPSQTQSLPETTFKWRQIYLALPLYTHKIVCSLSFSLPSPPLLCFNIVLLSKQVSSVSKTILTASNLLEFSKRHSDEGKSSMSLFILGCLSSILQTSWISISPFPLNSKLSLHLNMTAGNDCVTFWSQPK